MSHAPTASSFRQAQLGALQMGFLREHPSPARIAAYAAVIALHAAAFVLLLMPVSPPTSTAVDEDVVVPNWIVPDIKPVTPPPPPPPAHLPRTRTPPRDVAVAQPPIVVPDGEEQAPPPDPTPDTATPIESAHVEPVGPIASGALEYVVASPPPYPRDAERRRIEGTVVLEVLVGVDGTPLDVRVATSSRNRSLDEAARKHILKHWKFKPATQDGHAVQAIGLVPVRFTLR